MSILAAWLLVAVVPLTGTPPPPPAGAVVVDSVAADSAAARAGLKAGDALSKWTRGTAAGVVESPLDVWWVEIEQGPRGPVTFEGQNGNEGRSWTLGQTRGTLAWGLATRPDARNRDARSEAWRREGAARSLADARKWTEADDAYREALEPVREDPTLRVWLLQRWAETLEPRRDWTSAVDRYRQALDEIRSTADGTLLRTWILSGLGATFARSGDNAAAEAPLTEALAIRKSLVPESPAVAATLNLLGLYAWRQSEPAKAEAWYLEALAIERRLPPDVGDVAGVLDNLSLVATARGDLRRADALNREALRIFQTVAPGALHYAMALHNSAMIAHSRGDWERAEARYLESLAIKERLAPNSMSLSYTLNNLGNVACQRGDRDRAATYYRRSLEIKSRQSARSLDVASTLSNLGEMAREQGDLDAADAYYDQALAMMLELAPEHVYVAQALHGQGAVRRARGDLDAAEKRYREALAIFDKVAPGSAEQADSLAAMAAIQRTRGRREEAAALFSRTLDALEQQNAQLGGAPQTRVDFRAARLPYYKQYIDLLLEQGRPDAALHVVEQSRAQALREMLAEAGVDVERGVDPALLEKARGRQRSLKTRSDRRIRLMADRHTDRDLAAANAEVQDALRELQQIQLEIRESSPAYAGLTFPQPATAAEVQQQLLDADTVLLMYDLDEERSHVWCVTPTSLVAHVLPGRAEVETAARRVYEGLTARNEAGPEDDAARRLRLRRAEEEYPAAAAALSRMVLGPVAATIEGKRLLIVGDGALQYVPFEALPGPDGGELMVARHEIVYLPSASVALLLRREREARGGASESVAVLADPVFDKDDARVRPRPVTPSKRAAVRSLPEPEEPRSLDAEWSAARLTRSLSDVRRLSGASLPRLRFTRREAEAVLAAAPPGETLKALDFEASREAAIQARLRPYRLVHFATHGLLDSEHPELSGLVLSLIDEAGQPREGFLDLQDIYNLDLRAEVAVLSACETGLGKNVRGEGLIGLTRGFMYAGASRVVASLWKVDDVATAELMARFYRAMKDGERPAAALRQAKIGMWKERHWHSPYYWAAFAMQGEWR